MSTKVVTGKVRFSFCHIFEPQEPLGGGDPKYSVTLLIPKNDTTTVYKVASNDFMAAGGDGYTMFGREIMVGPMLNEVFADYLAELYPPQN